MAWRFTLYFVCLCSFLIIHRVNSEEEKDSSDSTCDREPQSGPCMAYYTKWFFNATSKNCSIFIYGGCGGNENNFESKEDCEAKCLVKDSPCSKAFRVQKIRNFLLFHGKPMYDGYTPDCDEDGYFKPKQCKHHMKKCWCVDRKGNKIKKNGKNQTKSGPSELDCSSR